MIWFNLIELRLVSSLRRVGGQVMMTKDSNIVLVVDDDPGMLKCV